MISSGLGSQLSEEHVTATSLEKNVTLMMKTVKKFNFLKKFLTLKFFDPQLHEVQSHHPIGFVSFLTPTLQLIYTTIIEPRDEGIMILLH